MNDERSREFIKQLYWIMDNFCSTYKVCKEFLISKGKKVNFSNISALLPVCTVDICSLLYARTTIIVWRLLLLQINIICILQKTKNFFRECSTLGISVYTVWESCRSSATSDLWLKPESWSLNFKFFKKIIQ